MNSSTRPWKATCIVGAALMLLSMPWWASPALLFVVGMTLTASLFALSWNLLFGYAGISSFGHAAFFTVGSYFTAIAIQHQWPLPFLLTLLIAACLGSLLATAIGMLTLTRLSGIHFAVLTLAVAEVIRLLISASRTLGADDGLSGLSRPAINLVVVQVPLQSNMAYYLFMCLACMIAAALLWWLCHSRFGRVLQALRQDPERAAFIGLNVARYRVLAFTISGGVTALAGALTAPWTQIVTPESAGWLHSAQPMLNTLLGGASSFWGPVVGSAVNAALTYSTRTLPGVSELVSGTILLLVILIAPEGITGSWRRATHGRAPQQPKADQVSTEGAQ